MGVGSGCVGTGGGGGLEAITSSSICMLERFCRVFMTARWMEERDQLRRSSSSNRDSSSETFVVSVFWSLNSAILAARMSAGVMAFLGSGGTIE